MRGPRLACIVLLVALSAGCRRSPEAPSQAGPPSVVTTSAADPSAAAPGDGYEVYKIAARQQLADGELADPIILNTYDNVFDVYDCLYGLRSAEVRAVSDRADALQEAAIEFVMMEASLRQAGYSEEVIRGPLERFEADLQAVASSGDANLDAVSVMFQALARGLETNRARLQPGKPRIIALGECGAGEAPTKLVASPADGRVWLATKFSFNVCRAQRLDPWDRARCNRWSEANQDEPDYLSGRYVYQAEWPDGHVERGEKTIVGDPGSEDAQVITVRRR